MGRAKVLAQERPQRSLKVEGFGLRYLLIGAWNSVFGFLTFFLFIQWFDSESGHFLALTLSYVLSIVQSHAMQRRYVWESRAPYILELSRFSYSYVAQYGLNTFGLFVCVNLLDMSATLSQILLVAVLTISFFFVNKNLVFKSLEVHVKS